MNFLAHVQRVEAFSSSKIGLSFVVCCLVYRSTLRNSSYGAPKARSIGGKSIVLVGIRKDMSLKALRKL